MEQAMRYCYIYAIRCSPTKREYVGSLFRMSIARK